MEEGALDWALTHSLAHASVRHLLRPSDVPGVVCDCEDTKVSKKTALHLPELSCLAEEMNTEMVPKQDDRGIRGV